MLTETLEPRVNRRTCAENTSLPSPKKGRGATAYVQSLRLKGRRGRVHAASKLPATRSANPGEVVEFDFEHMDNQPPQTSGSSDATALPQAPITQTVGTPVDPPAPERKQGTTKETVQGLGCLAIIVVALAMLVKSCFFGGGISKSDLKNPPVALERIARKAFDSEKKVESVRVDTSGPGGISYDIFIEYESEYAGGNESTFNHIRSRMNEAYRELLKYPQFPVTHIQITAKRQMRDKYGNAGWEDVYTTSLQSDTIRKLNRSNLDAVDFRKIWEVVYIHQIYWEFKD